MFNIIGSVKKIIGIKKDNSLKKDNQNSNIKLKSKINQASSFIDRKIHEIINEYHVIRQKMKNLYKTNYELGLRHLEKGNISEAAFRFKLIKKFWPEHYEAYYQLAYCLVLLKKFNKAKIIINELLSKDPSYKNKVQELLTAIEDEERIKEKNQ